MVFSSPTFLFIFLPLTIVGYYLIRKELRNIWLLLCSLFFYAWGEPKYVFLMLISIFVNYCFGIAIEKVRNPGKENGEILCKKASSHEKRANITARVLLILAVVFNLAIIGYFKYAGFFVRTLNGMLCTNIALRDIALPIGISFFTFQNLSYVIDVYRGEEAQHNFFNLALYISLFAQLIAGPIVRYKDIQEQLQSKNETTEKFFSGMILFMIGFSKKVLIADQIAPLANQIFDHNGYSTLAAITGAIAYTLQIYFDFSGYSDMAIGLGRMFGFEFNKNFDYPYRSESIREFWRRWHISLSTWFRDYVYIPLGGSRVRTGRVYLNLIIVFALTGLWHGASWNFVVWGLYYGVILIAERAFLGEVMERTPSVIRHICSLTVITFGWILFRADGFMNALAYIRNIFNASDHVWIDFASNMNRQYVFLLIVGTFLSIVPVGRKAYEKCCSIAASKRIGGGHYIDCAGVLSVLYSHLLYDGKRV